MHSTLAALLAACLLTVPAQPLFHAEDSPVNRNDQAYGKPNPNAPPELARFAFLIGRWGCEGRAQTPDGEWHNYKASWVGRYILDGYVIEDEYRMTDSAGKLIVLGNNYRSYDAATRAWNIRWLDALSGSWTVLASPELGGATFDGRSVSYVFREPTAGHAFTRATYTSVSPKQFTWRGEKSSDRQSWTEFMTIDCWRVSE